MRARWKSRSIFLVSGKNQIKAIKCLVTNIVTGIVVSCTNSQSIDDLASAAGI